MTIQHIFTLCLAWLAAGCGFRSMHLSGEGEVVKQEQVLRPFKEIDIDGTFKCVVSYGRDCAVVLQAHENLLPYVLLSVQGNTLKVMVKKGFNFDEASQPILFVTTPRINAVTLSGVCQLEIAEGTQEYCALKLSGASQFKAPYLVVSDYEVDLEGASRADIYAVQSMKARISGAASLVCNGSLAKGKIAASGASRVDALGAEINNLKLHLSGAAAVKATVLESLDVVASGAAGVEYQGDPKINQKLSGVAYARSSW